MTPTHAPARPQPSPTADEVIRGLLALLALVGFVVGVPVALLTVAPWSLPADVPTPGAVVDALIRPDDGTLLLGAIQVIAWVAWAAFTTSVIAELIAAAGHVTVPHIPLLGGTQRLAATLVTTAGLLLVTSTPLTSSASAGQAVALTAPAVPVAVPDEDQVAPPAVGSRVSPATAERPATTSDVLPTVTVQRGDTLWDLAERHLRDGHRYTEILALNLGHPQVDGRALDGAHWIYPGWQLRLPTDATALPPAATPADPDPAHQTHTVQPGETLWEIAGDHLGDPARYPELLTLNQGLPQPDGDALTDPDLIEPGWTLTIPVPGHPDPDPASVQHPRLAPSDAAAVAGPAGPLLDPGTATPDDATPDADDEPAAVDDAAGTSGDATPLIHDENATPDHATGTTDDAPPLADDESSAASDTSGTTGGAPSLAHDGRSTFDGAPGAGVGIPDDGDVDDDASSSVGALYLGLTAFAAAGVIGELTRRRRLQQRTRRAGQRIALPAAGSAAQDAERTLRDGVPPVTVPALKQALLNLASRCYTAERDLPRLAAITLTPTDVVLHLSEDDPDPVQPFTAPGARTWIAPHSVLVQDPVIEDPERPEPFPALVTLGHTTDGTVLINLEAAGTLTLTGDVDTAADVLRALVAELATSDLTGRIGLITGPEFTALARACDPARLQVTTPESLTAQITGRSADVTRALHGTGADDTLQARSDRAAGDIWLPVVYITTTLVTRPSPWSGSTVIGLGSADHSGWTLDLDADRASLDPLGITLQPQRLTQTGMSSLIDLLTTATPSDPTTSRLGVEPLEDEVADVLAALPSPADLPTTETGEPTETTPLRINVLGPITIDGLPPEIRARLSRRSTELLVYLALRGQATGPELDEALWHGQRIDNKTRNSLIYRTRQRVGAHALPVAGPDGTYRLGPTVTNDWAQFTALARRGLSTSPHGITDLQAALDLVRDRPLLGVPDSDYSWAEYDVQQIISTVADIAHVLATLHATRGQHRQAMQAAAKGLLVDTTSSQLAADLIAAAEATGNSDEVQRLQRRLQANLAELDPELV